VRLNRNQAFGVSFGFWHQSHFLKVSFLFAIQVILLLSCCLTSHGQTAGRLMKAITFQKQKHLNHKILLSFLFSKTSLFEVKIDS